MDIRIELMLLFWSFTARIVEGKEKYQQKKYFKQKIETNEFIIPEKFNVVCVSRKRSILFWSLRLCYYLNYPLVYEHS